MAGREEDVRVGANKYTEKQSIGTGSQSFKDYIEPPFAPLFERKELASWSFYRAAIAEFVATFLFLYILVLTVIGVKRTGNVDMCNSVGLQGIAWAVGGMIFILVYCTAGISGGHINPAVTLGLLLARKLSIPRAMLYMLMQCLGATCGAALVKTLESSAYDFYGGGVNSVSEGYSNSSALGAEIVGTFVLVYTVFSATDAKRNARDSHVQMSTVSCSNFQEMIFASISKNLELRTNSNYSSLLLHPFNRFLHILQIFIKIHHPLIQIACRNLYQPHLWKQLS